MSPQDTADCFAHSGSVHSYSETRSRSHVKGAHTHTKNTERCGKTCFFCKFWVYLLDPKWWYLWHKTAFKMPHEFPTISLDTTKTNDQKVSPHPTHHVISSIQICHCQTHSPWPNSSLTLNYQVLTSESYYYQVTSAGLHQTLTSSTTAVLQTWHLT